MSGFTISGSRVVVEVSEAAGQRLQQILLVMLLVEVVNLVILVDGSVEIVALVKDAISHR